MLLVALAMVAIISMAALSIDVATLYVNREEAQRAADAAALAGARVISLSGITTNAGNDATSWQGVCGSSGTATQVAKAVAAQNGIGGTAANTVNVNYSAQGSLTGSTDCSSILSQAFAINPTVIVQVQRTGLPTLFSRIWSRNPNSVSATAAAEVFNPSSSNNIAPGGDVVPVTPHCVKPILIPNLDPAGSGTTLVDKTFGTITSTNVVTGGGATPGIGEGITLTDSCSSGTCPPSSPPPLGGHYVPALISSPTLAAVPTCATDEFQSVVAGCDETLETTVYACGTAYGAQADPSMDRGADISAAVKCVTNIPTGNDTLDVSSYPFKIIAGSGNPILSGGQTITSSNSVITVPIYDQSDTSHYPSVTIVGFMQMFVSGVDSSGDISGYLLNVAGCGNDASTTLSAPGTSPVPIRLITPQ